MTPISPDCRDGNCQKCYGDAWDEAKDEPGACHCEECNHDG